MSIKTTLEISRYEAIDRIIFISNLFINKKYKDLENNIHEDIPFFNCINSIKNTLNDYDIFNSIELKKDDLEDYPNSFLEGLLDNCCFRYSYFDNYIIV